MTVLLFCAAQLAPVAFGAGAAWHPSVRSAPVGARLAVAWAAGIVVLAVTAMVCSVAGVGWSVGTLAAPALAASVVLGLWWRRHEPLPGVGLVAAPPRVGALAGVAVGGGLLHLTLACLTTRSGASDLLFFWGVKAVHFADAGGFAAPALTGPYALHTHPTYPPLHPVVLAWSVLVAGELPWRLVPMTSVLFLVAAVPIVVWLLRPRLGPAHALAVTGFWTVALAGALVQSGSGGNAEAALVLFETIAVAALLGAGPRAREPWWLAALGLVGAVLTKSEGAVAAVLVIVGLGLRDRLWCGRWCWQRAARVAAAPAAAWALWLGVRMHAGLPLLDPIRERALAVSFEFVGTILRVGARVLHGGVLGLAWLVPLLLLAVACRRRRVDAGLLPALTLVVGLIVFLVLYYLHARGNPVDLITWTAPRVTLPALSALILAAGVASAPEPPAGATDP
jgi:hypothetical protein